MGFHFVLLNVTFSCLCLLSLVYSQCPMEIPGCFCMEGDVQCRGTFPNNFLNNITSLDIIDINMDKIPVDFLQRMPLLRNMKFISCNINTILPNTFQNLKNISIHFQYCRIDEIQPMAFNNLETIEDISFSFTTIGTIKSGGFSHLSNISMIYVTNSNITLMEESAFFNFTSISSFSIMYSNIGTIKRRAFSDWNDLATVSFSSDKFQAIECQSVDTLFLLAKVRSFYANHVPCTCTMAWALDEINPIYSFLSQYSFSACDNSQLLDSIINEITKLNCSQDNKCISPSVSQTTASDQLTDAKTTIVTSKETTSTQSETSSASFSITSEKHQNQDGTMSTTEAPEQGTTQSVITTPQINIDWTKKQTTIKAMVTSSLDVTGKTESPTKQQELETPVPVTIQQTETTDAVLNNIMTSSVPKPPTSTSLIKNHNSNHPANVGQRALPRNACIVTGWVMLMTAWTFLVNMEL